MYCWVNAQELCTILAALVICVCTALYILFAYFWRNSKRTAAPKKNVKKIGQKRNVEDTEEEGNTELMRAVSAGDVELIKRLIQQGADVNAVNNGQDTALHLTSQSDDVNILRILIEAGADLNAVNKYDYTAIVSCFRI